jgi:hypothetical protein
MMNQGFLGRQEDWLAAFGRQSPAGADCTEKMHGGGQK